MSAGKDQHEPNAGPNGDALNAEIDRTMAEAEAAVAGDEGVEDMTDMAEGAEDDASAARIQELEGEVATLKDRWLRAVADLENYKKRTKREIDEAVLRTTQKLLPSFLPVMDNLERALEVAEPAARDATGEFAKTAEQVVAGLRMVATEFNAALTKNGIEPVAAVGKPFDPAVHDALQQFDSPDHAPGVVIREFEKGYRMKERLVRPARVIVAGPGSTGAPPAEASEDAEN